MAPRKKLRGSIGERASRFLCLFSIFFFSFSKWSPSSVFTTRQFRKRCFIFYDIFSTSSEHLFFFLGFFNLPKNVWYTIVKHLSFLSVFLSLFFLLSEKKRGHNDRTVWLFRSRVGKKKKTKTFFTSRRARSSNVSQIDEYIGHLIGSLLIRRSMIL